jgi:hypothetical protein
MAFVRSLERELSRANAKVDYLFVKGRNLSALAYGDPFLKMSANIHLFVEREAVGGAVGLLLELGYEPLTPPVGSSPARIAKWHRRRKESDWLDS